MQDVELAVAELSVIKELGLHGIEIRSNIEGRSLGEERFRPLFREAAALGLAVFPHANRPTFAERLAHIPPIVADAPLGFPIESGLAGASIIWSGLLDELPDLRICISHGGGVLMQLLARSDENWHSREPVRKLIPKSPMEYAAMLYYDDITFGTAPPALPGRPRGREPGHDRFRLAGRRPQDAVAGGGVRRARARRGGARAHRLEERRCATWESTDRDYASRARWMNAKSSACGARSTRAPRLRRPSGGVSARSSANPAICSEV